LGGGAKRISANTGPREGKGVKKGVGPKVLKPRPRPSFCAKVPRSWHRGESQAEREKETSNYRENGVIVKSHSTPLSKEPEGERSEAEKKNRAGAKMLGANSQNSGPNLYPKRSPSWSNGWGGHKQG